MFRRFQFTFPEGAIFISRVDQKLSILQEKIDDLRNLIRRRDQLKQAAVRNNSMSLMMTYIEMSEIRAYPQ